MHNVNKYVEFFQHVLIVLHSISEHQLNIKTTVYTYNLFSGQIKQFRSQNGWSKEPQKDEARNHRVSYFFVVWKEKANPHFQHNVP
jgi:hypothetical protein